VNPPSGVTVVPRDVARLIRAEENDRAGDLLGATGALPMNALQDDLVEDLVADQAPHAVMYLEYR
jgi:hypothetical protein